jgi:hypothetical protein
MIIGDKNSDFSISLFDRAFDSGTHRVKLHGLEG